MTRSANARIAGLTFLLYIGVAFPAMVLFARATAGASPAAKLASVAASAPTLRLILLLSVASCFSAFVLAATLFAITREEDRDLALVALVCRASEGVISALQILALAGLLWLVNRPGTLDTAAAQVLGAFLIKVHSTATTIAATFFAAGSTLFSWLLLRGRIVPTALAWLGVVESVLLVLLLPAQLSGWFRGAIFELAWAPMLIFEISLGVWLLTRGAAVPIHYSLEENRV